MHKGAKGRQQRVVKGAEVQELVQQLHSAVVGGCHFGINATHHKIVERYWWPTMTEDIKHFVRTCER